MRFRGCEPALQQDLSPEADLGRIYRHAGKAAEIALRKHREIRPTTALPVECPYELDQILADDWCPEPPGAAK